MYCSLATVWLFFSEVHYALRSTDSVDCCESMEPKFGELGFQI